MSGQVSLGYSIIHWYLTTSNSSIDSHCKFRVTTSCSLVPLVNAAMANLNGLMLSSPSFVNLVRRWRICYVLLLTSLYFPLIIRSSAYISVFYVHYGAEDIVGCPLHVSKYIVYIKPALFNQCPHLQLVTSIPLRLDARTSCHMPG